MLRFDLYLSSPRAGSREDQKQNAARIIVCKHKELNYNMSYVKQREKADYIP